jgi:hypothetical protein
MDSLYHNQHFAATQTMQKFDYYRDKDLLNLARDQHCLLQVPEICTGGSDTIVACHSNSGSNGKGKGIKASDADTVWGCASCHHWLDQGPATKEEKENTYYEAYTLQIIEWFKISRSISLNPRKVEAARNVLKHLGINHG